MADYCKLNHRHEDLIGDHYPLVVDIDLENAIKTQDKPQKYRYALANWNKFRRTVLNDISKVRKEKSAFTNSVISNIINKAALESITLSSSNRIKRAQPNLPRY